MPRVLKPEYLRTKTRQKLDARKRQAERFRRMSRALEVEHGKVFGVVEAWRRWENGDNEAGGRS